MESTLQSDPPPQAPPQPGDENDGPKVDVPAAAPANASLDALAASVAALTTTEDTLSPPAAHKPASSHPARPLDTTYRLKPIVYVDPRSNTPQHLRIITQNRNGPCPLLALCNVLILRGDITIRYERQEVNVEHLLELVGDWVTSRWVPGSSGATPPEQEEGTGPPSTTPLRTSGDFSQNLTDVFEVLPTLQTGLDVNVRFDSPTSFELTPALLVFDLFQITLCHGWTVDPHDTETHRVIVQECKSYNAVVEKIIAGDDAAVQLEKDKSGKGKAVDTDALQRAMVRRQHAIHDGLVCTDFLAATASQLTYHGLQTLGETLSPNSLSVLFRNNHFSTLYTRVDDADGSVRLYTLVTDQGFLHATNAVWETMDDVQGDSSFVDGFFTPYAQTTAAAAPGSGGIGPGDYTDAPATPVAGGAYAHGTSPPGGEEGADFALAVALQQEEDARLIYASERRHAHPSAAASPQPPRDAGSSPTNNHHHHHATAADARKRSDGSAQKKKEKCRVM
ncbi:hypothetical protein DFJ77DRAFT_469680 [Powellomyces hirtus]|nr:hypothetical protein DFJ77DRAFT_469680 [Powellomyces hirtus]